MKQILFYFLFCILLSTPAYVFSKKNKVYTSEYKCDVCKAIVEEIEHDISKVDPAKTIQVGSFRVDPNGKTRTVQKKYARSETHVSELVDDVCGKISENYIEFDDDKKTKRMKRLTTMDGKINGNIDYNQLMEDVKNGGEGDITKKGKTIKFQCNKVVEQMEDDLMEYFQNDDEDKPDAHTMCAELTDYCKKKPKSEEKKKEEL